MTDREKVIKGLECCLGSNDCDVESKEDCPYKGMCLCAMTLYFDVLALLKKQEAKRPVVREKNGYWDHVCPTCGSHDEELFREWNYCPFCGQEVKWE